MFRWGIIFLVIALIAAALGLVDWLVRLPARRKSSSSSDRALPGQPVHGP